MEQSDNKGISLVYQSQLFTDIDSIVSNRTNSVDFPMTRNNLLAIDRAHLQGIDSPYAYRRHRVIYIRDGIQIFSGYGTLLSISDTAIKFTFTWGNVSNFKTLLETRLRDLSSDDNYVYWETNIHDSNFYQYYDMSIDFGATTLPHPVMPVSKIIQAMQDVSGVRFKNPEVFSDFCIPLVTKNNDDFSRIDTGISFSIGDQYVYRPANYNSYLCCLIPSEEDVDLYGFYIGNGIYDVSNVDKIKLHIKAGGWAFCILAKTAAMQNSNSYDTSFSVYAVDSSGANPKKLASIPTSRYQIYDGYWYYKVEKEYDITIDVTDVSNIILCVNKSGATYTERYAEISFVLDDNNVFMYNPDEQYVVPGSLFPLWKNLPDWDCAQLLKNLMKIKGLFAFTYDDGSIEFVSIDRIYENRSKALDWTDKLAFKNGLPTEQTMMYGNYARRNLFKYAEDDTVTGDYDGVMEIDDANLDYESALVTLDFAATDSKKDGSPVIPEYYSNGEGSIEFREVEPRILRYRENTEEDERRTTFKGMDWSSLLNEKYIGYWSTVNHPRVIKANVILNAVELSKLDLLTPVYSFSLGHYYAITKLTTKENDMAEVELLRLTYSLPDRYEVNNVNDLIVVSDDGESYYATIPSMSDEQIQFLRDNPNYKVCLIRMGYTRRGNFIKYTDKTGKEVDTNTHRAKFWKYRGGKKWRIIGEELLVTGKIAPHSQTLKYYADSSLVFDLLDTIILPPMRKPYFGGSRNITKYGRIRNPSRNGIAELSIALYKRNDVGKWSRISNICNVRGRSDDKRQLWEFSTDNLVEVE